MRGGGGRGSTSIHFLKALLKTNSEINVSRLWHWEYLKYSASKIRISRCDTNSLIKAMLGMLGGGENLCGWLIMMELSPLGYHCIRT